MKKLFISILALVIALTACTADPGAETEETTVPPTDPPLQEAPTDTAEPTTEPTAEPTAEPTNTSVPTATPTPEPEPTETAEPTPTEAAPTEEPKEQTPPANQGTIPEDFEFPEGAVVVFTQTGGFAGSNDTWVFYENGRVTLNGADQSQLTPERIDRLVADLDALGFFEIDHITKPGTFCCDFYDYTLAVQSGGRQNFTSFSDGNLELPPSLNQALVLMRAIIMEAQER